MTSGNNGASTPEDDDPFGYLYADGQANGAQPPSGGYGYPNSVNRVRAVGQRQYGQQPQAPTAPTAAYGQVPQQQGAYGQPNAHYAAPETLPGSAPTTQQPMPGHSSGGGRGGGPNTKGLLIGAIAVVAAVVIGISVAMLGGDDDKKNTGNEAATTPSASQSSEPSPSASASDAAADLPQADVKTMRLEGGPTTASDVKGAKSDGGVYVQGFNQVGASVTWTVNGIEKAGVYRVYVRYGLPAEDANATVTVNGKPSSRPLNMKNFGGLPANQWQETWAQVSLTKGTNTIQLSCQQGNQCNALLDQFRVTENVDQ
ncbi:carbohydrate-binding protein [Streptomyces griseorubiginosus]|uniref:carbohydrate-binding protein n=1 Tax=Streptomyces griseorubiginosus TaxID=67304 RepID=UPI002E8063E6|nr:carbohydrate-binding protein [Streptomyces griseorubiginosus]WUB46136.1 carbohydrate-binding protein [Streptomyces griseorubiginosus]WUB54657.1 carbohydrate-binding protein [Streptomyces griseorubiginosus]